MLADTLIFCCWRKQEGGREEKWEDEQTQALKFRLTLFYLLFRVLKLFNYQNFFEYLLQIVDHHLFYAYLWIWVYSRHCVFRKDNLFFRAFAQFNDFVSLLSGFFKVWNLTFESYETNKKFWKRQSKRIRMVEEEDPRP